MTISSGSRPAAKQIDGPGMGGASLYGPSNITAGRVRLDDLTARNIKNFSYLYDMGDNWEHDLRIEKILPADPQFFIPSISMAPEAALLKTLEASRASTDSSMRSKTQNTPITII